MENKGNIYIKLAKARVELHEMELKKSGENKFANFKYFELGDFLKQATKCLLNNGLVGIFNTYKGVAILKIYDESGNSIDFRKNFEDVEVKGANKIQNTGATSTYMKRYLYMDAMELAENDSIDGVDPKNIKNQPKQQKQENKKNIELNDTTKDFLEEAKTMGYDIGAVKTLSFRLHKTGSLEKLNSVQLATLKDAMARGEN